ncbi:PIN-like domain-containing protein [Kitasatospora sp. NPDC057198]|uniref:PIN-like domain-containing protein n=1 Tax=Kitasatospora sp. NPDC057198 TaxID=3346046 RepID=UPI0036424435
MVTAFGLFDGFEAHRTPNDDNYSAVLAKGLVVLDTNVLLDLYRMNARVRKDMLKVLKAIEDRIWIPHQVVMEFWRNRQSEDLVGYHDRRADSTKKDLQDSVLKARRTIEEWIKQVHIEDGSEEALALHRQLERSSENFKVLQGMLDAQAERDRVPGIRDTNTDPVIKFLEDLFTGRVGAPYDEARHRELVTEARRRGDLKIPPGYKDFESGKKGDIEAAGDYLVWQQLLDEVSERKTDVLFVTRDIKEDWWRAASTRAIRMPRTELVDELRSVTGRRLFMVEPSLLMQQVIRVFGLGEKTDSKSVAALQQFESAEATAEAIRRSNSKIRYRLAQLPGGRSGDYFEIILVMAKLVAVNPRMGDCLQKFMEEFQSVTLEPEARRRLMNLVSLGLAVIEGDQVHLTDAGETYVRNYDRELLANLFIERIEGASEARELLREGVPVSGLRVLLAEHPALDLSATQSDLLLRWMERLGVLI